MTLVARLDDIAEADATEVGGKALALARVSRAGLPIPRTICLFTTAYERFVDAARLRPVIRQELGRKRFADLRWEEIWDAALRIRNRFLRSEIPPSLAAEIGDAVSESFGDRPLVVRSSAPGEDAAGATFAGLHDSFVGVEGSAATLEAIRSVWASLWTDRALLYRRELGLDVDQSRMAVVIQELVEGSCSGIAFGVHPVDPDLVAVEAVYGLNQGLVDGTIEPDRWSLARDGGRVLEHVSPTGRRRLVRCDGELIVEDVPADLSRTPPLSDADLAGVFEAVRGLGELFGAQQDIEWTRAQDRLVLLQSRPITTARAAEGDQRAWYLSLTRSLGNLRELRERVEEELLPAMDREVEELGKVDLRRLEDDRLAAELDRRRAAHDRWVEIYTREFIPLAHGIRLFGHFYNEVVRPEDPYEFMSLLAATPMLSMQRNQELARLASRVREDPDLRVRLGTGKLDDDAFERELRQFERTYGDAVYDDQACFGERERLASLLLSLADAPPAGVPVGPDVTGQLAALRNAVGESRRDLLDELLELGRAAYRLRDDDNLHLGRLEALVLEAAAEIRRRLGARGGEDPRAVVQNLRHPNLVVEPRATARAVTQTAGFVVRPRQLVGQPAGPGVAQGTARIVRTVDDLFLVQRGEVLVCDAIDPNMTFVVPLVSAIVERRGGMLVHGAIIAREYGLPCVTGVPDATERITGGDHLTVDGYLGIVTLERGQGHLPGERGSPTAASRSP